MKRLLTVVAAAIALSACSGHQQPHTFAASGGSGGQQYCVWQTGLPAVSGNSQTITLFDTTMGGTARGVYDFLNRIMITGNVDQTVTVNYDVQLGTSTTWVRAAGTNASYSFTGGTTTTGTTEVDELVQGNESRIQVVTGGTGPTASRWAVRLCFVRDLGQ